MAERFEDKPLKSSAFFNCSRIIEEGNYINVSLKLREMRKRKKIKKS